MIAVRPEILLARHTSKYMKSIIWKPIKGIFITCPPMSCKLHILLSWWSSAEDTKTPLFQLRYLIFDEDEDAAVRWERLWIAGLYHFVQIRNAKHSATLRTKDITIIACNRQDSHCSDKGQRNILCTHNLWTDPTNPEQLHPLH